MHSRAYVYILFDRQLIFFRNFRDIIICDNKKVACKHLKNDRLSEFKHVYDLRWGFGLSAFARLNINIILK